jgi:hypothetical protein
VRISRKDLGLDAGVPAHFREALVRWFEQDGLATGIPERDRLRYSSDLDPEACHRKIWYSLHGEAQGLTPTRETLGAQLRFWGGRRFEDAIGSALVATGLKVERQVLVKPLRPSAWCWAAGHADLLVLDWRRLLEIKAPRAESFRRARGNPSELVRTQYRYQLSAYFHELHRLGRVDSAAWIFLDREGSNEPVEVEFEGDYVIPLEGVIAEEESKAYLVMEGGEPPPRLPFQRIAKVWKGKPAGRNKPAQRIVKGYAWRNWRCGYCPWESVCQPGEAVQDYDPTLAERAEAIATAERRWASGQKTTPQIVPLGEAAVNEEDNEIEVAEAQVEAEEVAAASENQNGNGVEDEVSGPF